MLHALQLVQHLFICFVAMVAKQMMPTTAYCCKVWTILPPFRGFVLPIPPPPYVSFGLLGLVGFEDCLCVLLQHAVVYAVCQGLEVVISRWYANGARSDSAHHTVLCKQHRSMKTIYTTEDVNS